MTYQFKCTACLHEKDVIRSMNDTSIVKCPRCESIMSQVYSAVGVHFKCGGFYKTDYRGEVKK